MKRTFLFLLLSILVFASLSTVGDAQRGRRGRGRAPASDGKSDIPCPSPLNNITDCATLNPDTGCGHLDPNLNVQKNIRSDDQSPVTKTLQDVKDLPDPVRGLKIGDTREKLVRLGEGKKITVVAYALAARSGSSESCNCHLTRAADTDNHIVLVDEAALVQFPAFVVRRNSRLTPKQIKAAKLDVLHKREKDSITAEFTPRVRLDHPNLAGSR
jgi:hypothetical protein